MERSFFWLGVLIIAIWCSPWASRSAMAEIVVIAESFEKSALPEIPQAAVSRGVVSYDAGQKLADNVLLEVPACASLVVRSGGRFIQLRGPYQGQLSDYKTPNVPCAAQGETTRAGFGERRALYDAFFQKICLKENPCDETCTALLPLLSDKTLTCP